MHEFRFYFFWVILIVNILATIFLFLYVHWIFGIIFLSILIIHSIDSLIIYFNSIWWPYHKWIDTSIVDIEKVEIPSSTEGQKLKAVIIRNKNHDPTKKHIGVLFHHGYTGFKEKVYRFAIPLAMNDCVVLCPDARGHGESKNKIFSMNDFKGVMADVEKEIDFLENLNDVDKEKLIMMGHSMGGIATLFSYVDHRLKKIVAISAPYDMLEMFSKNKTVITKTINKRITKFIKKDPEFIESGANLEEWNKKISAKYVLKYEHPIPDKNRVYLVHCKQDDLVLFEESVKIKEVLDLPDENVLFMENPPKKYIMAAHNLTGQVPIIASFIVKIVKELED
ncbi:MAG: alpha/beta hydrolase family protein [Promethearchaeota archaeon]